MDVLKGVKQVISMCWSEEPVTPETKFVEDLEVDSLAVVEMMIATEDMFDIEVPDGEVDGIKTVQEAVDYIERKLVKK